MSSDTQTVVEIQAGKFGGAFGGFQTSYFGDLVRFGLSKGVAHKVAMDYGSDFGRAMNKDSKLASKVGKANKDGERDIRVSGSFAKVAASHAMSIKVVIQAIDGLFADKLVTSRKLPELAEGLAEYLRDCEEWASAQTWKE